MRILTITPSLGLGGTERAAQNFSIGYRRHGQDVTVLNHGRVGPREAPLMDAGIRVVNLADQFAGALKSLDAERFDVVHIHREGRRNDRETDLLRWARPRARLIAETNVFFARDYGEASHWIDLHLQLAAINQLKWLRRGGEGLSAVVPNPVDADDYPLPRPEAIQAFRTAHRISIGDFVFGRVGQPLMGKWDPCIVPAFAALAVRHPQIHLLLVGRHRMLSSGFKGCHKRYAPGSLCWKPLRTPCISGLPMAPWMVFCTRPGRARVLGMCWPKHCCMVYR